jgi:3-dehydroquinate dehydratase-1
MPARPIEFKGRPLAGGQLPAVCAPLVGRTRSALLAEAAAVAAKAPDLIEWRVDFFEGIADTPAVVQLAGELRQAAGGIPILFTRRSRREGGEPIPLDEPQVLALYLAVCASGSVDAVDYEAANDPALLAELREAARRHGLALFLSFHDFNGTPPLGELVQRFEQAERLGADVAKVAVMPRSERDVLVLLEATLQASQKLRVPVVSMSMAGLGALTRVCGGAFGSALTFAVGGAPSAPGQLPIEDVRAGLALLRRAAG